VFLTSAGRAVDEAFTNSPSVAQVQFSNTVYTTRAQSIMTAHVSGLDRSDSL